MQAHLTKNAKDGGVFQNLSTNAPEIDRKKEAFPKKRSFLMV